MIIDVKKNKCLIRENEQEEEERKMKVMNELE